ncbi:response regulator transcription factor [Pseudomonas sp. NW5]|uniref:response regulator transcription factor n=1 Tax=Pseudomonas sp. NW5 TaxID=2934934 RepID=UPI00202190F6|nr:response regulator transcription factor [Pseudomonas sp. NW5]MCL7461225.1 response regulator transcription factor [Pseudomonas sp. NW5]
MHAATNDAPHPPHLLWIDLTTSGHAGVAQQLFSAHCTVQTYPLDARQSPLASLPDADMLCLQFDAPDAAGLNRLVEIRQRFPHLPITMLTVQHSEELAVWAFRAGVWDYLTLPLSDHEQRRYLEALNALCQPRNPGSSSKRARLQRTPPLPETIRLSRQPSPRPLQAALKYIDTHYRQPISEAYLAQLCGMSPSRFSRLFKQWCGIGFQDYLKEKRMQAARDLLLNSNVAISGVGYLLGFRDPSYFTRCFRQFFGCSPSEYRQNTAQQSASTPSPATQSAD